MEATPDSLYSGNAAPVPARSFRELGRLIFCTPAEARKLVDAGALAPVGFSDMATFYSRPTLAYWRMRNLARFRDAVPDDVEDEAMRLCSSVSHAYACARGAEQPNQNDIQGAVSYVRAVEAHMAAGNGLVPVITFASGTAPAAPVINVNVENILPPMSASLTIERRDGKMTGGTIESHE